MNLKNPFILAPLTNVTDLAFRLFIRQINPIWKSGLLYTEMIDAKNVAQGKRNTINRARAIQNEAPIGLQLYGTNENFIGKSIQKFESKFDLFDFNIGCPVKSVISQGAGVILIKRPKKIKTILSTMRKATTKPITAKIRLGLTSSKDILKTAFLIQNSGVDALCIHGRTAFAPNSFPANWNVIRQVREQLDIPVIGNGDVFNAEIAHMHLKNKDSDAIMIGRAALHNPIIFSQCMNPNISNASESERWLWIDLYYKIARRNKTLTEFRLRRRISDFLHPILSKDQLDFIRDYKSQKLTVPGIFSYLRKQKGFPSV